MGMQGLAGTRQGFVHSRQGFLGVGGLDELLTAWYPDRRNRRVVIRTNLGNQYLYDLDGGGYLNDIVGGGCLFADSPGLAYFGQTATHTEVYDYTGALQHSTEKYITTNTSTYQRQRTVLAVNNTAYSSPKMDGTISASDRIFVNNAGTIQLETMYGSYSDGGVLSLSTQAAFITSTAGRTNYSGFAFQANNYTGGGNAYTAAPLAVFAGRPYHVETDAIFPGLVGGQTRFKNIRNQSLGLLFGNPIFVDFSLFGGGVASLQSGYALYTVPGYGVYKKSYSATPYTGGPAAFLQNETPIFDYSLFSTPITTSDPDQVLVYRESDGRHAVIFGATATVLPASSLPSPQLGYYIEGSWLYFTRAASVGTKLSRINISTFATEDIVVL